MTRMHKPASYFSMANCINKLFKNDDFRQEIERKAYIYSREFMWSNVAEKHIKLFQNNLNVKEQLN